MLARAGAAAADSAADPDALEPFSVCVSNYNGKAKFCDSGQEEGNHG